MAFKEVLLERSPTVFVQLKGNPLSAAAEGQLDGWLQGLGAEDPAGPDAGNTPHTKTPTSVSTPRPDQRPASCCCIVTTTSQRTH